MPDQRDMLPIDPAADPQRLVEANLRDVPAGKWEKSLVEAIEVGEAELMRRGLDEATAFEQASAVVIAIAEFRGGRLFYWPRGDRLRIAIRDAGIYRRFNGRNIEQLVSESGLNVIHVYRILREQRALHVRRVQPELPIFKEE
jgi:Mor family transcriptional regulator